MLCERKVAFAGALQKEKFLTSQAFLKQSEFERESIENREELLCVTCSRDELSNFTDTENLLQYLFD